MIARSVRIAVLLVPLSVFAVAAGAVTAQQQRMTDCNAEAKTKTLSGQARKDFMKQCLSGGAEKQTAVTTQQQKMKDCNKEASAQSLKGDARKSFMSTCLSNK